MIEDYHLHTKFSFDSRQELKELCDKAVHEGIQQICFTDHVELGLENENQVPDFYEREIEIEQCRNLFPKIEILSGAEIGQPHKNINYVKELLQQHPLDLVIASVHTVSEKGNPSKFGFTAENCKEFLNQYLEDLKDVASNCDYDVMGHVTLPFRYIPQELREQFPIEIFRKEYMELFEIIVQREKGIEINTSGLRTVMEETLPNALVLQWYKDCGGRIITIGSDGHSVYSAFSGLETGYHMLKDLGYDKIATYHKRVLSFKGLDN